MKNKLNHFSLKIKFNFKSFSEFNKIKILKKIYKFENLIRKISKLTLYKKIYKKYT